jgi:fumarate reductase subunit C
MIKVYSRARIHEAIREACHGGRLQGLNTAAKSHCMTGENPLLAACAPRTGQPKSRWPARLDLLQSLSGLLLVLFMAAHGLFVATILISPEAMYRVTKAFEGYYLFGVSYPGLVSAAVLAVLLLFALHAALALRKFPSDFQQLRVLHRQRRQLRHTDTTLWMIQVYSGFALFFLASAHLEFMLMHPGQIGPFASADRTWDGMWVMGLLLLLTVEVHAGVGLYRLAVKWFPPDDAPAATRWSRANLGRAIALATAGFILLGLTSLGAYLSIGYAHRDRAGERYQPAPASRAEQPPPMPHVGAEDRE